MASRYPRARGSLALSVRPPLPLFLFARLLPWWRAYHGLPHENLTTALHATVAVPAAPPLTFSSSSPLLSQPGAGICAIAANRDIPLPYCSPARPHPAGILDMRSRGGRRAPTPKTTRGTATAILAASSQMRAAMNLGKVNPAETGRARGGTSSARARGGGGGHCAR